MTNKKKGRSEKIRQMQENSKCLRRNANHSSTKRKAATTNTYTTSHDYSDETFITSTAQNAGSIGRSLLFKAFCLYYAMRNPDMPFPLKLSVMASLAYLAWPIDAIPDLIPVLGYTDDGGVLAATFATVSCYIDNDVERKADRKVCEFFG